MKTSRIEYEEYSNNQRYVSINFPNNEDNNLEKTILSRNDIEQIFTYLGKDVLTIHDIVIAKKRLDIVLE